MEIRDILARHGFGFKKQFGQNFISDPNLLSAIVEEDSCVLEIGAGAGGLTRALAKKAKRVVSFEIDRTLQPVLAETLAGLENVEVVFADFEKYDLAALEKELGEYTVVANLPYYITTPVVMRFVEEGKRCRGLTVMVQEEVAARFSAKAGTSEYGAVTAAIALRGTAKTVRKVSRDLFTPRPNVDSAVVRIRFGEGQLSVKDPAMYRATVRAAFSSRRKTLENNLMAAFRLPRGRVREILARADVPEGARGETLSPPMFACLADMLSEEI